MTLRQTLLAIRKRWLTVTCFAVLGVAVSVVVTVLTTPIYAASATLFVSTSGTTRIGDALSGSIFALNQVKGYTELAKSYEVLRPVIAEQGLTISPEQLAKKVSASIPPGTALMRITANSPDAATATAIANSVADSLARKILEIETPTAGGPSPVKPSVVERATTPTRPVSPRIPINLGLGLLVGIAIGSAVAVVRYVLDKSIKTSDQLAAITGSTPLGCITYMSEINERPLLALDQSSIYIEGFREVRTNLEFVDVDSPPRAFAVTSALPNEGKSIVASNLAIALAQAGKQVCLVDADLRRPRISQYLGVSNHAGLTNVLAGQIPIDHALVKWNRGLLNVLPAGPVPPNPPELLASHNMKRLVARLRETFDHVVFDTSPLLPVSDGAIVANACDGAVVIVRQNKTTVDQLQEAVDVLARVDARVLGTVMNFKSGKGYGYGYGYGVQETPPLRIADMTTKATEPSVRVED